MRRDEPDPREIKNERFGGLEKYQDEPPEEAQISEDHESVAEASEPIDTEFVEDVYWVNSVTLHVDPDDISVYNVETEFSNYKLVVRSDTDEQKKLSLLDKGASEVLCDSDELEFIVRAMKPLRKEQGESRDE